MRIQDVVRVNGEVLAYCVGEDLPIDLNCKRISVGGRVFNVLKVGTAVAFCGKKNALMALELKNGEDIPRGEFKVIQ